MEEPTPYAPSIDWGIDPTNPPINKSQPPKFGSEKMPSFGGPMNNG
jgi:hypothetical protein